MWLEPALLPMAKNYYAPQMPCISHTCKLAQVHIWDAWVIIYASYEPNAINNVTRNTDIHKFYITGICLEKNTPVALHICPTELVLCFIHKPHITVHTNPKKKRKKKRKSNRLVYLALMKITLICEWMHIYCYVVIICSLQYVCVVIYTHVVHPSGLNTWNWLATLLHESGCSSQWVLTIQYTYYNHNIPFF